MKVGLDRLLEDSTRLGELRRQRVGLLTHPAAVTAGLVHVLDALIAQGITPKVLFGPEHGFQGGAQDMAGVASAQDPRTGARVVSLYGETFARLSPTADELADIDVLVCDLQDVGARYYTFVWTVLLALRACSKNNVRVIILDRPNPINGVSVEGSLPQEERLLSFVGLAPVPIRHGRTLLEIVQACAIKEGLSSALEGIEVTGWNREETARGWDRPFVMPSPNMPTIDTAIVYPGGCLVEATSLSEGRGTTRPFELVGSPSIDGHRLAASLNGAGLAGFIARPITFEPTFQKCAGRVCGGVQIHVTDVQTFRSVATYLALLTFARAQAPDQFHLRTEPYEYVDASVAPALDLLTGTTQTREALMSNASWQDVVRTVA